MALVIFSSELQKFTGEERVEVSASTYRQLVDGILKRYPDMPPEEITEKAVYFGRAKVAWVNRDNPPTCSIYPNLLLSDSFPSYL